jgi:class 3 adenylate cyclase
VTTKRRYSVLFVLLAGFSVTSILGVGLALYVGLGTAYKNTRNLWVEIADIELSSLQRTMRDRMTEVRARSDWVAEQVANGALDPSFQFGWDNAMRALSAADMNVMAYGLITGDRQFIGYDPSDMREIRRTLPADDMLFSELTYLRGPSDSHVSFPRWDPYFEQTVFTNWTPLFYEGRYVGTFIQYLSLSNLSGSLIQGRENVPGTPFILVAGDRVMAHPDLLDDEINSAAGRMQASDIYRNPVPLPTVHDLGDPVLSNLGKSEPINLPERQTPFSMTGTGQQHSVGNNVKISGLDINDNYYIIVTRQVNNSPIAPAVIGIYFSEEVFDDEWNRLVLASVIGAAVFILAVIVAFVISKQFTKPIRRFAAAARAFEDEEIASSDIPQLSGSRIREYDDAARSFNHMMVAVHDRERITSLFGKFVPQSIAKKLLASGNDSGVLPPQQTEATVLFIDIVSFTSMCERLEPQQIIAMLNDYFDCATRIIEERGGIITQFQGDAILAVYNVFDELENHADAAVDSAIAIQKEVERRTFEGLDLKVRCGVNTGSMVAGNVGAKARLSFTVHGDAVNTASRLEQENKVLGTSILISESTRNLMADPSRVTKAGDVLLRGRHTKTELFTTTPDISSG